MRVLTWVLALCVLSAGSIATAQTTATVMPVVSQQFLDANGNVLASGTVDVYLAGTTTRTDSFTTSAASVANANPVVLDAAGRAVIFLNSGTYRFDVSNSASVLQYSVDNVTATHLVSHAFSAQTANFVHAGPISGGAAVPTFRLIAFEDLPTANGTWTASLVTMHDAAASDAGFIWDGNAQDYYICLRDALDDVVIGLGNVCGTTPIFSGDENRFTAIGGAVLDYAPFLVTGTYTSGGASDRMDGIRVTHTLTGASGDGTALTGMTIASTITTQATDTIATVATLYLTEPTITVGASATVTNATTLYIDAAPTEGTNDYALWVDAGAVRLDGSLDVRTSIGARAFNSANISIPNNTNTALTFDSERFDTDTIHSTSSNTDRLTATTAGKYVISCTATWAANTTGQRRMYLELNNTTTIANVADKDVVGAGATADADELTTIYDLAATDYVRCFVHQNSGGALNISTLAQYSPEFMMHKLN